MADHEYYNIYMAWNNAAEAMYFPVMPQKMELKRKGKGKTYDIVGLGQINSIQSRDLAEISFESFFPNPNKYPENYPKDAYYPFLSSEVMKNPADLLRNPSKYIYYLTKWQDSKNPLRFIYSSPQMNINLPVSIEQFDRWEEAGSEGDVSFKITLKEYVFHSAKKINTVTENGIVVLKEQEPDRPDYTVQPETYTLKAGDTLLKVARMQLGDSGRWREIQKLNGITDSEIKRLPVGKVLKLPKK